MSWFYEPNSHIISRKAPKSFMVMTVLVTSRSFMRLVETFWKTCAWLQVLPPLLKSHIYWPFPLPLWSSFSEVSEVLSPELQSSFLPKIKLNSQLSHCAFFFGWQQLKLSAGTLKGVVGKVPLPPRITPISSLYTHCETQLCNLYMSVQ